MSAKVRARLAYVSNFPRIPNQSFYDEKRHRQYEHLLEQLDRPLSVNIVTIVTLSHDFHRISILTA